MQSADEERLAHLARVATLRDSQQPDGAAAVSGSAAAVPAGTAAATEPVGGASRTVSWTGSDGAADAAAATADAQGVTSHCCIDDVPGVACRLGCARHAGPMALLRCHWGACCRCRRGAGEAAGLNTDGHL